METIIAILIFVIISVLSDRLEGGRKKKRPKMPQQPTETRPRPRQEQPAESRQPDIVIPPIKGAPQREPELQMQTEPEVRQPESKPSAPVQLAKMLAYQEKLKEKAALIKEQSAEIGQLRREVKSRKADIHTDVVLNAITYAQILEQPKAYRYMMNRKRR